MSKITEAEEGLEQRNAASFLEFFMRWWSTGDYVGFNTGNGEKLGCSSAWLLLGFPPFLVFNTM